MEDKFLYLVNHCFNKDDENLINEIPNNVWIKCRNVIYDLRKDCKLNDLLKEFYAEQYRNYLSRLFINLWKDFSANAKSVADQASYHHRYTFELIDTVNRLVSKWFYNPYLDALFHGKAANLKKKYVENLQKDLYTAFISDIPLQFSYFLRNTFKFSLDVFNNLYNKHCQTSISQFARKNFAQLLTEPHHIETCETLDSDEDLPCCCQTLKVGFFKFRNTLRRLGLFDQLCSDIIKSVLYTSIEKYIFSLCKDIDQDISGLDAAKLFFEQNITFWIRCVLVFDIDCDEETKAILNDSIYQNCFIDIISKVNIEDWDFRKTFENIYSYTSKNMEKYITNTYVFCRLQQLFEIVKDYPFTERVVKDLNVCITFDPFYRQKFIATLKSSVETRLLHPGVSTSDIIDVYVTFIKALRLLDPQGVILEIVCDPVRSYLKNREDTIRCIITMLTGDSVSDLKDTSDLVINDTGKNEECLQESWQAWNPNPIGVTNVNKTLVKTDIISMLVNIFESKDLFVQVYQKLVSQRLLTTFEVDLTLEHRNLEILSLRFGEHELHNCEVMLKDIKDSERINQRIRNNRDSTVLPDFNTNAFILSEQFWPENLGFSNLGDDLKSLKLPGEVKESLDNYITSFEMIKANRTIKWVHQLGLVKLELQFDNGKNVEFNVRPIQAVIIHSFQQKKKWAISELATELDVAPSLVRLHIKYWQNIGLLIEVEDDQLMLDEENYMSTCSRPQMDVNEFDNLQADVSVEDNKANEKDNDDRIYWNCIDNMLTNLNALTLDRIFNMLKVFPMPNEMEIMTMHELKQFLDRKVSEGKLVYLNGEYNIKPNVPG